MEPAISLTPRALTRIEELKQEMGNQALMLRVYITGGGCSGFQYGFNFEQDLKPDDVLFTYGTDPVTVTVDPLSLSYLDGSTIDYISNLQGAKFLVSNPNAESTCGCGSSFSL